MRESEKERERDRELVRENESARVTGWRRLIGSPKLQIIFHKRATKYRALLRKITYKDKGSYESLPPCSKKERERKKDFIVVPLNITRVRGICTCRERTKHQYQQREK